jgi:hypothetical protein
MAAVIGFNSDYDEFRSQGACLLQRFEYRDQVAGRGPDSIDSLHDVLEIGTRLEKEHARVFLID